MKKILLVTGLMFFAMIIFTQPNNPKNQDGIDFWASVKIVKDDFNAGKVTEFNQQSLDYYISSIQLKKPATAENISLEVVASILKEKKNPNFDINQAIASSSLSNIAKNDFKVILNIQKKNLGSESFTSIIEEIKNQEISTNEK